MKKILFGALFAGFSLAATAQNNDYLTFRTADGAESSLAIDGLKITFKDGVLVAANGAKTLNLPLDGMDMMFFAAQPTGLQTAATADFSASIRGGVLSVTAPAGTAVQLYAADGRLLGTYTKSHAYSETLIRHLAAGVYVVKADGKSLKIMAK